MRIFQKITFSILQLLILVSTCIAQNLSNKGKDFWVGYGLHQDMEYTCAGGSPSKAQEMILYFSADNQAANITLKIEGTTWFRNYSLAANSVMASDLIPKAGTVDATLISAPCSFFPPGTPCGGEQVFVNKAIHVTSDVPIVVYAHIYSGANSGASMLMPVETWGYSYTTLNSYQQYSLNSPTFSWAYAIAQHDNTVIEVKPSQITRTSKPANVPFTVTLNRGDIYQFMAGPDGCVAAKPNLSGSVVKSIANAMGQCYPIAVFAGSSRTSNPISCGSGGGDNDNQQCIPTQAWGKRYLTAPTSNSVSASSFMRNSYRIAVKDPTTIVKRNGIQIPFGSLLNNNFYFFESSSADYIEADKPIMVAQFMTGGGCMNGGVGDPEMIYISPIEQGIKSIGFYRNNRFALTVNYLTLIIPTAGVASLTIDGSSAFTYTYPHPNLPGYTVVIRRWTAAQAQAKAQSDSAFTAITYGLGSVESYGYNAGTLINNLNAVGSIFNASDTTGASSHPFTCTNTPVELSVLLAYPTPPTRMVWLLSQVGGGLSPNTNVTVNAPTPVGASVLVNGVPYFKYSLPGTYTFTTTGTYQVPIAVTHPSIENCINTDTVSYDVIVNGKPSVNFNVSHTGCVLDTVYFAGVNPAANGYNINQWLYTFPDATTKNQQNASKLFTAPGTYNVKLSIVSNEGCVNDTTKQIIISPKPVAAFTAAPVSGCVGTIVNFTSNSTYSGTAPILNYYWNFGDGTNTTVTNAGPVPHNYTVAGTYTVKHTVGVTTLCVSDTITRVINIYAQPTSSFTFPTGCLPATGTVQFNSTASSPDGQAITGHLWTFGDPASGAANTSTLANPTHTYPGFGTYTITYRATTANGCFKDTTVTATFNLAPTFNWPALPAICQNAAPVSVATATVTNGVPGSGVYQGPGTSPAGMFNPAVAGAGTHTIKFVYTTTANCIDTAYRTIVVNPTPNASWSIPNAGCLPTTGAVNFTYNGTVLPGQTYAWNFGDPASGAANTSGLQNPSHNFTTGSFTITLTVTSIAGCVKDSVRTTTFNLTPALAYPALTSICESVTGTVSVATATVTNGVTGTGVYSGPGTNAAGQFSPSTAGAGTHTITYTFTSASGCSATITQTITVFAKPAANFTYPTTACLPTTGTAQFTYTGSMSAGQTYAWNFGDPASGANNTSTLQNPAHNYSNTGSYTVAVTVTNSNGCVDTKTITTTFSVTPALTYPPLAPVCESTSGTINVATATVTNGVAGTGVYSGPGTNAAGQFNPVTAGPGTHTITYTFTSTGSCSATVTSTIAVSAKPTADFTYPTVACLPTTGLAQFTYTGSSGAGNTYAWNFGDPASGAANTSTLQNPAHTYSNTGSYTISLTVTNANGCTDTKTVTHTFSVTPALAYPALGSACANVPQTVATATVTNGVAGTGIYSGPGTSANGDFDPVAAGPGSHTITYTFTSTGGCTATITSTITVYAVPVPDFSFPAGGCLPTTGVAQFTYTGSAAAGQTYLWNFGDPASGANNTSTLINPTHTYSNTGTYTVTLTVTSTNGCSNTKSYTTLFSVTPSLAYPALSAVCESVAGTVSVATATVTNGVSGTGVYSGPGTNAAGQFNPSAAGAGTHTITYTFTSTGGCTATITSTITVNAKPAAEFTYPTTACLPTTGLAQFTYTGSAGAGNTYAWNFGDPASGANNTSTIANPTHNYTNTGSYTLTLTVTNANGCTDTKTVTTTFSVTPALAYPALTAVCESVAGTVSVATATVTNGVSGTGVYSGAGTNAAGQFNPSTAGAGTHTITYTFTSTGGCSATITSTIVVDPKPAASFTITNAVCEGAAASIQDNSGISSGSITEWRWDFGDGTPPVTYNNNNPFTHAYTTYGTKTVTLVTVSNKGCISAPYTQTVTVSAVPFADFGLPPSVCMPGGVVNITNRSTTADGSALTYSWNFGDGTPASTAVNPSHTYAAIGSYNITLTVTGGGGCTKDTVKTFSAFFDKPVAAFTVSPDELCQGTPNVFTDASTAPNSSIAAYTWNFGDGSATASQANPTKMYNKPGVYDVTLTVTSNEGCVSDAFSSPVTVYLQPVVDAGPSFVVPQGTVIQFKPSANDSSVTSFTWSPATGLNNPGILRPVHTANADQVYTLTATVGGLCTASDTLYVKILRPVIVPNAFSPNGDGTNDTWIIENLSDYAGAVVEVYNRYGQMVYTSRGYSNPWEGTSKGKPLPVATYYYIIQLNNGFKPLNGSITIIR